MSSISGGGGPPKVKPGPIDLQSKEGVQEFREATGTEVPKKVLDSFEKAGPQIESRLKTLATKGAGAVQFTNQDLAEIARMFAATLRQKPNASRKERAAFFARALVKNGRFGRVLDQASEQELEGMFELIAGQLDGSPVFAQLVDDVTEGAKKMRVL